MGLRSLIRNVHWLNALAAATIIVSCAPRSSSDAKSTAYDTDIVDERRASGRFTLKTEVIDDKRSSRRKSSTRPVKCVGKNTTSRAAPTPMTAPTKSLAVSGRVSIKLPRQPSDESSPRYLRSRGAARALRLRVVAPQPLASKSARALVCQTTMSVSGSSEVPQTVVSEPVAAPQTV